MPNPALETIFQHLNNHRVGVLAFAALDGKLHAAAMHYSYRQDPLQIYFLTDSKSKKVALLQDRPSAHAALVVGDSWEEWVTLQMEGTAHIVTDHAEIERVKKLHFAANPDSAAFRQEPFTTLICFVPEEATHSSYRKANVNLGEVEVVEWKKDE